MDRPVRRMDPERERVGAAVDSLHHKLRAVALVGERETRKDRGDAMLDTAMRIHPRHSAGRTSRQRRVREALAEQA
ncbi:MAG: hypothetical protein ACLP1X_18335 [Polyangiaceae bacterium]